MISPSEMSEREVTEFERGTDRGTWDMAKAIAQYYRSAPSYNTGVSKMKGQIFIFQKKIVFFIVCMCVSSVDIYTSKDTYL